MSRNAEVHRLWRKNKIHISKTLSVPKGWCVIGPVVAEHIAGPHYTPIPYLVDCLAYQIGHIFVQQDSEIQCFCAALQSKVIGPIRDFLLPAKSSPRWLAVELPVIKTTGDNVNFRVIKCPSFEETIPLVLDSRFVIVLKVELGNGNQMLQFNATDCYFLDLAPDMRLEREVTIDRSTHEDLHPAQWFGLITGVVVSTCSDITMRRNHSERKFYIGATPHAILFKYVVCKMNRAGGVYETSANGREWKWLPVTERDMDSLPLTEFVSQSSKIKS